MEGDRQAERESARACARAIERERERERDRVGINDIPQTVASKDKIIVTLCQLPT
jgi:hypothetical protein